MSDANDSVHLSGAGFTPGRPLSLFWAGARIESRNDRGVPIPRVISLDAEGPAQPRTGPIVTANKARWRLIIPIAIERDIPRQIAGNLDVVCRIHVELYAAWLIECGKECSGEVKVRFVKLEQPYFAGNQPRNKILGLDRDISFAVSRVLPCKSTQQGDCRPVRIFQVPSDTGTDRGLKLDALYRALQEVS